MADNLTTQSATPATIPASTVIATDDAGASGHVQIVKLARSTDGSATPITADADGMLVNLGANNDVTVTGTVTAQDGGGSLTVDGTVAVSSVAGTVAVTDNSGSLTIDNAALSVTGGGLEASALRVTLASDSTGVLSVDDNGGSLTVDGTVAVSGTVAVTDNSGSLTVDNAALSVTGGGVEASALRVTLASDSTGLVSVDDNGGSLTVDGTVTVGSITAGDNTIGRVKITDGTDVALVDGSGNLMVNVAAGGAGDGSILDGVSSSIKASVLDYTNSNPLAVRLTDTNGDYVGAGAGTQYTEDAAAAADPVGTMAMAVRADTPAAVTSTDGDNIALRATNKGELYVKQSDSVAVTGTVTANLAAGTNNIGDVDILTIAAGDNNIGNVDIVTVPAPLSTTGGGTEATALRVTVANDSTGVLSIDDNGGSLTVDGTVAVSGTVTVDTELPTAAALADNVSNPTAPAVGAFGMVWDGATWDRAAGTSADGALVNLGANNDVTVTGTVTANLAAGTNNIGDVDILSIAAGDNNIGNVDIVSGTITTVSTLTGGGIAHDAADSGNPVKVGARAALTLADDTMVANADRTDLVSDADGALIIRDQIPLGDVIFEAVSDTGGSSTAFTNFGATASARNYVTSITVFRTDTATTMAYIDFRDGTAGSVIYRVPLPPAGGATINMGGNPLFYTTANTALAYDVSSALTTVYISITGFKSKVRA